MMKICIVVALNLGVFCQKKLRNNIATLRFKLSTIKPPLYLHRRGGFVVKAVQTQPKSLGTKGLSGMYVLQATGGVLEMRGKHLEQCCNQNHIRCPLYALTPFHWQALVEDVKATLVNQV